MTAKALVIGIDEYKGRPLTSAVNDALAFRATLINLGLVPEAGITMLRRGPRPSPAKI